MENMQALKDKNNGVKLLKYICDNDYSLLGDIHDEFISELIGYILIDFKNENTSKKYNKVINDYIAIYKKYHEADINGELEKQDYYFEKLEEQVETLYDYPELCNYIVKELNNYKINLSSKIIRKVLDND